jgi:phage baseplate assembly protein W
MAFGGKKISPIDLNVSKTVGIDLPLNGRGIFKPNFQTKDSIKSSLINFLLTNPGERYLNPLFGAGIKDYIFSQLETGRLDFLKEDVESKLNSSFPNISITKFEIFREDENNTITIKFTYDILNTGVEDGITISFT